MVRPSWQSNVPGIPAGTTRLLPDIALQASSTDPGFLFCTDDLSFLRQYPTCGSASFSLSRYPLAGGTSFAAPTFAAMLAVLNQNTQTLGQGNVNPILTVWPGTAQLQPRSSTTSHRGQPPAFPVLRFALHLANPGLLPQQV